MKSFKKIVLLIVVLAAAAVCIGSVYEGEPSKQPEQVKEPKPLIIEIPERETSGSLTVLDEHGEIYYQYCGEIGIVNDGDNGEEIDIVVNLTSTPCSCFEDDEPVQQKVVLYDRTNKAIMQYLTYPKMENGVLLLQDSDLIYQEHDSEWDNMIEERN